MSRPDPIDPDTPLQLLMLRHAPTEWNDDRRLQGRSNQPLSDSGRALAQRWRLPAAFVGAPVVTSPLIRAKETAEILAPGQAITEEPALIEMDWGAWEGQRLRDIRRTDPEGLAAAEARGRDITPPGGESPRQVWTRLEGFLRSIAPTGQPGQDLRLVAVCHKGVMRALMAEACNWDMTGPPPINPARSEALLFRIAPGGAPFDWVEPVSLMPEEA